MRLREHINQGLCDSDAQRLEQLRSIRTLHAGGGFQTEHEFLYRSLTILDDKASALLSFNSIMLAAIAVFLTSTGDDLARVVFLVAFLIMGASCCLCLQVVRLYWSDTDSLADSERFWLDLNLVRDHRTRVYRIAWLLAGSALLVLVAGAVFDAAGL